MNPRNSFRDKYTAEFVQYTTNRYQSVIDRARGYWPAVTRWSDIAIITAARDLDVEFEDGHEQIEVLAGVLEEGQE